MRKLSRHMPKKPPQRAISGGACLLTAALVILLTYFLFSTAALLVVTGFIIFVVVSNIFWERRMRRLAAGRTGESICTFARSFPRRMADPWVIRAVYEELMDYYDGKLPILAADSFEDDLQLDWEDLDYLTADIAARAGRSIKHARLNPYFDKVKSVRDLVMFLSHQPKLQAPAN